MSFFILKIKKRFIEKFNILHIKLVPTKLTATHPIFMCNLKQIIKSCIDLLARVAYGQNVSEEKYFYGNKVDATKLENYPNAVMIVIRI